MKEQIFIGGAWPYANNQLHIGHLAALLPGDFIARYYRQKGAEVLYVSGSDCHGTPITVSAKAQNLSPSEIAQKYHSLFSKTFANLDFSYDLYTATMTDYHKSHVQQYIKKIYDRGYIYEKEEDELFCENCNKFISDREIKGTCPVCGAETNGDQCDHCLTELNSSMIINPRCKLCGHEAIKKKNKHLYFSLHKLSKEIQKLLLSHKNIWRQTTINETDKYLKQGLKDRALTRQIDWGVELPFKNFEDKRMYVWFDALMGYLTAGERYCEEHGKDFWNFITDKNTKCFYILGKDNIVFHTIILPGILQALNPSIQLPDMVVACEYVNLGNAKMSKSKGNLITVDALLENFDSDSIRYFFMFNNPEKKDTSFSINDFVDIHNKHLAGGYGNFVNRNLSFLIKRFGGELPKLDLDKNVKDYVCSAYDTIGNLIEKGENRAAVEEIFNFIKFCNKYYDESAPWTLYESNKAEFDRVTSNCLYLIANLANISSPLMPKAAAKVKALLNVKEERWGEVTYDDSVVLKEAGILFNRIKLDEVKL